MVCPAPCAYVQPSVLLRGNERGLWISTRFFCRRDHPVGSASEIIGQGGRWPLVVGQQRLIAQRLPKLWQSPSIHQRFTGYSGIFQHISRTDALVSAKGVFRSKSS